MKMFRSARVFLEIENFDNWLYLDYHTVENYVQIIKVSSNLKDKKGHFDITGLIIGFLYVIKFPHHPWTFQHFIADLHPISRALVIMSSYSWEAKHWPIETFLLSQNTPKTSLAQWAKELFGDKLKKAFDIFYFLFLLQETIVP